MPDTVQLETEILAAIAAAGDEAALEAVRIETLGKSGSITTLARLIGKLPSDERKGRGTVINQIKDRIVEAIALRRDEFKKRRLAIELGADNL